MLKNNVRARYSSFEQQVKAFLKQSCLQGIAIPTSEPLVRNTIGTLISNIYTAAPHEWPELVPILVSLLNNPDMTVIEVRSSGGFLFKTL